MALSHSEKTMVADWIRNYPSGIEPNSWGRGPMEAHRMHDDEWDEDEIITVEPEDTPADVCREFG